MSLWRHGPHRQTRQLRAISLDGKALKGSARLDQPRRHLLSVVTQGIVATITQAEVGAKTNETKHFRPLLEALDLTDAVVTFDALHSVKANITWLVEEKQAHRLAGIEPVTTWRRCPFPRLSRTLRYGPTAHHRRGSKSI